MAEFNFGNRAEQQLNNIAKEQIIRTYKGLSYFAFDNIREDINKKYLEQEKEFPELFYDEDRSSRLIVPKIISVRFGEEPREDEEPLRDDLGNVIPQHFDAELATCSISKAKNVVVTPILNEKGSIKQITGHQDYKISIKLFLVGFYNIPNPSNLSDGENMDTEYAKPTQDIATIKRILDEDVSLKVTSDFLSQFDINNIVIQSFSFPQEGKHKNIQEVLITAISDSPKIRFI